MSFFADELLSKFARLALGFLLLAAFLALASSPAIAEKRVALVVSNSKYSEITGLKNPADDLGGLDAALRSVGFDVILKTNVDENEFDEAIGEFARRAIGADAALFYYAGHDLEFQRERYFLPIDARASFGAIGMERVLRALSKASGVKMLALDSCRDNPIANKLAGQPSSREKSDKSNSNQGHSPGRDPDLFIADANKTRQAATGGPDCDGAFTRALIKRIKEPGLENGEMFHRLANDVSESTGGKQRPEITISLLSDYLFELAGGDSAVWTCIHDSENLADLQDFIKLAPASPRARDAESRLALINHVRKESLRIGKVWDRSLMHFPKTRDEAKRYVIVDPGKEYTDNSKLRLALKTKIGCNTPYLNISVKRKATDDKKAPFYEIVTQAPPGPRTLLACGFRRNFNSVVDIYVRKLPIVLFAPEDFTVTYAYQELEAVDLSDLSRSIKANSRPFMCSSARPSWSVDGFPLGNSHHFPPGGAF